MADATPCPDCGVAVGSVHHRGCDVARCLVTGGQRLSCDEPHNHGRDAWTGEWPGRAECEEFGWWCYWGDPGWVRIAADKIPVFRSVHPDITIMEDLNRLHIEAVWDPERRRFVRRETAA